MHAKLATIVESVTFERFIVTIIVLNAVSLGIETEPGLDASTLRFLQILDRICLIVFTVELLARGAVYKSSFFRDPWRVFDLVVVGIAWIPASGPLSVLRALRVLRTLRMISVVPSLRRVVNGLLMAIPGLTSVGAILILIFYVGAVIATKLFGEAFPVWFGTIWSSAYSLFQIMTLESWSMGIVRPVMATFPFAWLFFIPFILIATFTMLNLFIAVIVNAMQAETDRLAEERDEKGHDERRQMLDEIRELRSQVEKLVSGLEKP